MELVPEGENGVVADNAYGSSFLFPEKDGVTGYHDITRAWAPRTTRSATARPR
jgi:hypothetical protein